MNAVKFDWLNEVGVLISSEWVNITLSNGLNNYDPQFVSAEVELKFKVEAWEVSPMFNPENGHDVDFNVPYVDENTVCFISNWSDNVHAINSMPFKLTGDQINTINDYLKDEAQLV